MKRSLAHYLVFMGVSGKLINLDLSKFKDHPKKHTSTKKEEVSQQPQPRLSSLSSSPGGSSQNLQVNLDNTFIKQSRTKLYRYKCSQN